VSAAKAAAEGPEVLNQIAHWVARGSETVGIVVIVVGAIVATGFFLRELSRQGGFSGAYHRYRIHLGRSILLGLEFLVAADIIGTVAVDPTFRSLGVLALIVVIRTFLSFALEVEINGHWPWQDSEYAGKKGDKSA
jgi:uncharacterized membrane protein